MNQPLRTIRLYGILGKTFGRVHRLAVDTPREAIKALSVLIPGFERYMLTSSDRGLEYAVFVGKNNIGENELAFGGQGDIRIAPVINGRKRGGIVQTIIGAVLIVAGVYFNQPWAIQAGVAMVAGGVIQMLSPQAKGLKGREAAENAPSYAFGGAVNTTAAGNPVGLLYGRRRIGGAIISAGIYAEDIA